MKYKEWLAEVLRLVNEVRSLMFEPLTVEDLPTIDFRHLHRAQPDPRRAADIVQAIYWFLPANYKKEA